jgi:hypothetical protein
LGIGKIYLAAPLRPVTSDHTSVIDHLIMCVCVTVTIEHTQ